MKKLPGLVAATFTPFTDEGDLAIDVIDRQCEWLVAEGAVGGVFICGTTGESFSLTVAERMSVAERWTKRAGDDLDVIVHVGHGALRDSQELAAHAESIGAAAVATLGPVFFEPASLDDLVSYCRKVAAAAPGLPFHYYHIPSMTGLHFPMIDLMMKAEREIPNFSGIKFTFEDLMDYHRCLAYKGGKYAMFFGRDEILLSALALGATSAVGTTYSFAARLYQEMMRDFAAGDISGAREKQIRAQRMITTFLKHGGLPAGKAMMKIIGIDCGPVRQPLHTLSEKQQSDLRSDLESDGFFDFCQKPPAGGPVP